MTTLPSCSSVLAALQILQHLDPVLKSCRPTLSVTDKPSNRNNHLWIILELHWNNSHLNLHKPHLTLPRIAKPMTLVVAAAVDEEEVAAVAAVLALRRRDDVSPATKNNIPRLGPSFIIADIFLPYQHINDFMLSLFSLLVIQAHPTQPQRPPQHSQTLLTHAHQFIICIIGILHTLLSILGPGYIYST